jgi:excisionase family DNA binding protein
MTAVFAHHGDRLLYRVGEAADMLGISRSKAWELLARNEIESVKIDGARRITRAALDAYVAGLAARDAASA